jgi:SAM-dependent methyltransferase
MADIPLKLTITKCPLCEEDVSDAFSRGRDFEYSTSGDEFTFVKCRGCGVLYLNPRPDISELYRIYPDTYIPYNFDSKSFAVKVRNILEKIKALEFRKRFCETAAIMDAGCGGPGFLENLRKVGRPGWKLWGNDINDNVIKDLKERGFETAPGRFEELRLPDASFDAIFFKQVLEHLEKPKEILDNAARLLKPGGRLVIETPNYRAWDATLFSGRYWGGYHFPRHWTIFEPDTLSAAGQGAGLRVERISFMLSPSFWFQSVHHFFLDRGWPGFVCSFFSHKNVPVMCIAVGADILQMIISGRTSNMRVVFIK